jgi:hypothetical protein
MMTVHLVYGKAAGGICKVKLHCKSGSTEFAGPDHWD